MFTGIRGDVMIKTSSKNFGGTLLRNKNIFPGIVKYISKSLVFQSITVTAVVSCSGVSLAQDVVLDSGNTTWTSDTLVDGDLYVGYNNKDIGLTIANGAKVYSTNGYVGYRTGSSGTVTVSGPGSSWIIPRVNYVLANDITVNQNSTLNIENGGNVDAKYFTFASTSQLNVTGNGSTLTADRISNSGTVLVGNGGSINAIDAQFDGLPADGADNSLATFVVRGAGSKVTSTGTLTVGANTSIEDGGAIVAQDVGIGTSGSFQNFVVTGAQSRMDVNGTLTVNGGYAPNSNISIADSANLNVKNGITMATGGHLTIGGKIDLGNLALGGEPKGQAAAAAGYINPDAVISFGSSERAYLNFNHTQTGYVFANALTGDGNIKSMSGETILTGDLSKFEATDNLGGIIVDGGSTLVLASNLGTGVTNYDNVFAWQTNIDVKNGTFNVKADTGAIRKNFLGSEYFSSNIDVWGDRNAGSAFGRLIGSGAVGNVTLEKGALISPGNSDNAIGTFTVNGNLSFGEGSAYDVDIAGNGASDKIVVQTLKAWTGTDAQNNPTYVDSAGKTSIANNVSVQVTALDAATSYQNGQTYTILSSAGGIQGQFAQAISKSAFLDVALAQTSNQVDLTIAVKDTGTPNPGTPNPGNPDPGTPNPGTPNPGNPDPGTPNPGNPDPGTPNPGTPNPGTPSTGLFDSVAVTGNQRNVARALNTLQQSGQSLALYNSLLPLSAEEARHAFEALSGEVHASALGTLVTSSTLLRNSVNDRMRASFNTVGARSAPVMAYADGDTKFDTAYKDMPLFTAWGQGFGTWNSIDGNGNAADLSSSTGGFVAGLDIPVSADWRLGAVGGYSRSSFDANDRSSFGHSDNYHLGMYAGAQYGELSFRSGLTYTWHQVSTNRSVAFSGFNDHLKADYDVGSFQAFGELGYRIDVSTVAFEPFANLTHVNVQRDGFNERGGIAALSSPSDSLDTTLTTLGLRASSDFMLGGYIAKARGMLGWQHAFGDTDPTSRLAFVGSQSYVVSGTPLTKDAAVVELGIDVGLSDTATIGIGYSGEFGSNETSNSINAKLDVRF
ncbi:autotransporter domain-containing protein [Agrobacterium vitis]|nr:autotransporter domain-containing protein [Agrobacterium vitis]MUO70535.1 autotransporter domain-containing protein [Agrobacterium vitis]MUO82745.1 autotransporter domain-containing protein [Agrobacterium vitis]MVA78246.1 autotransporter domain-containing protein [Agrobacterium vitis]